MCGYIDSEWKQTNVLKFMHKLKSNKLKAVKTATLLLQLSENRLMKNSLIGKKIKKTAARKAHLKNGTMN